MRTIEKQPQIESEVLNGEWFLPTEPDDENLDSYKSVGDMNDDELAKSAALLKCSPELLTALNEEFRSIRQSAHDDLAQIWELLEQEQ